MKTTVRRAREDDVTLIFEDFKKRYANNPLIVTKDYFNWQFYDHEQEQFRAFIGVEDDKLVAFQGYQPFDLHCGDRTLAGGYSLCWFSDVKGGIGLRVSSMIKQELDAMVYLYNTKESFRICQKLGMYCFQSMPRWVGVFEPEKAKAILQTSDEQFSKRASQSANLLKTAQSTSPTTRSARLDDSKNYFIPPQGVKFWAARTGQYLNHRYVDIPGHDYRIAEGQTGLAVWRVEDIMHGFGAVIRLLEWTLEDDDPQASSVMSAIVADAQAHDVILIDFYCTVERAGQRLEPFGMFPAAQYGQSYIPRLFRPLNYDDDLLPINGALQVPIEGAHLENVYFTRGDGDYDRVKR
ncbi:hypothetical protein V5T82_07745 [Magnetovibrio sp. PR-2]|uniref:hypothetical protein n=1 Tax=Magnetovibrio sp. PR-2 TaxID=3120356 RepID=UPI002FCE5A5A